MSTSSPNHPSLPWPRMALDAAAFTVLLGLGVMGLASTFGGDPRLAVAGFGGILLGLGLAAAAAYFRLGPVTTAAAAAMSYVLLGSALAAPTEAIAGVLPGFASLRTILVGAIFGWKDILTVAAPVGVSGGMLVVPFLASLLTGLAAGLVSWRGRRPLLAMLPVIVLFIVGIAFGTKEATAPLTRGTLLIAGSIAWLAWRRYLARTGGPAGAHAPHTAAESAPGHSPPGHSTLGRSAGGRRAGAHRAGTYRRLGLGAAVLVAATVLTAVAAPALTAGAERRVLRDVVVPPVRLYDYPSPLMKFRQYVKDKAEDTLLQVSGLPAGERVRLAALDSYDGVVFTVNPRNGGNFAPVGDARRLGNTGALPDGGTAGRLEIDIADYTGVWLPSGGTLLGMEARGPRVADLGRSLFYNDDAGTALSTVPLVVGDGYAASVSFPAKADDELLAGYDFAPVELPEPDNVPDIIASKAAEFVGQASTPIERVRQLEQTFKTQGYFSNGKEDEAQSLSGHGAARLTRLLDADQMIGDDEQYATAMALMARGLGIPARVVMGFYPDPEVDRSGAGPVALKGKDVHAWVEVPFDTVGWVAFDPTPDKDNVPTPPQEQPKSVPKPQVLQPPPPPQEPAELPPDSAPDPQDADQKEKNFWDIWGPLLTALGIAAIPLAALIAPLLLIAWLKLRRRTRRFRDGPASQRVGGGWRELLSLATDLGAATNIKGTRRENSRELAASFPAQAGTTTLLAEKADAAVFGRGEPTEAQVQDYWELVGSSLGSMTASVGFWRRQRARYSPRSLIQDARARLAGNFRTVEPEDKAPKKKARGQWQRR